MKYVAALYAGNRVVTGLNHGDAFSKLNQDEQNGDIESGFLDPVTGRFFTDDYDFYLKQIYLIRHGEADGSHFHASLTAKGREQSAKCADFLYAEGLDDFLCLSSPADRCRQTAEIIAEVAAIPCDIQDSLRCQRDDEPSENFLCRIAHSLSNLPPKTLIVSHTDYIVNFVQQAIGAIPSEEFRTGIPNCAVIYIEHRRFPEQW